MKHFRLEWAEVERRHRLVFEAHEEGRLTTKQYLNEVIFYQKRSFTHAECFRFICELSKPYSDTIELVIALKKRYGLKVYVVSNESRGLNAYRIRTFKLDTFVDCFVSSCFVHLRKPDAGIFHLALDLAQTPVRQIVYIENTPMFVQVAEGFGIRSITHTDFNSTRTKLAAVGLKDD